MDNKLYNELITDISKTIKRSIIDFQLNEKKKVKRKKKKRSSSTSKTKRNYSSAYTGYAYPFIGGFVHPAPMAPPPPMGRPSGGPCGPTPSPGGPSGGGCCPGGPGGPM